MRDIPLAIGEGVETFRFDPARFAVLRPPEDAAAKRGAFEEHLVESPPLDAVCSGKRVLVVVSDLTRPTGALEFLPRLMPALGPAASVRFIFSTGIHRPLTPEEKARIVGSDLVREHTMLDHDPESGNTHVGETSFGNRVEIDDRVLDSDLIVLTGAIGFHYFAGFSGGRKSILPGVASRRSIEFNHLLVLNPGGRGRNPNVEVARMDGNPVHEDMVEGVRLTGREYFLYNTILDRQRRVSRVWAGHWIRSHEQGAHDYLRSHSVPIPQKRRMALVSCGGFPRDINMIQAHKALEFAQHAVVEGGTIILLAQCPEGMGHPSFFPWFDHDDLEDFGRTLNQRYEVYGQTAFSLRSKARRFRILAVTSLEPGDVRKMGMEPAATLEDALAMVDPGLRTEPGFVLPYGAEVLPRIG